MARNPVSDFSSLVKVLDLNLKYSFAPLETRFAGTTVDVQCRLSNGLLLSSPSLTSKMSVQFGPKWSGPRKASTTL